MVFQCSGIRNEPENSGPCLYIQFWSRTKQAPFKGLLLSLAIPPSLLLFTATVGNEDWINTGSHMDKRHCLQG